MITKTLITDLGKRIAIIGPSNAGKSTLCHMLGQKIGVPSYHLDQIQNIPHTNWQPRPKHEFTKDHDKLIAQDAWVIDGCSSSSMPQRFARATSIIWINPNLTGCIYRYLIRSLKNNKNRFGGLEGAKKEFSFALIKYMVFDFPPKSEKYQGIINEYANDIPLLKIDSMKQLNDYYKFWDIKRP